MVFSYRHGKKQRKITIGAASAISAKDARDTASKLYARVKLGEDPATTKAAAKAKAAETFGAMLPAFLAHKAGELRARSLTEMRRYLCVDARPLHDASLAEIDRRCIARLLKSLSESNGPVASNRVRAYLSSYFAWLMREGVADANPTIGTNSNVERSRDRVLNESELRAIWRATEDQAQFSAVVRLLILTGCRRTEIGGLLWREVDLDKAVISLPAARTKNAQAFDLPLSPPALAILRAQPRTDRAFVFGVRARGGFCSWDSCRAALDKMISIEAWRLHDLRRSTATGMADIGILPHVIEQVLNHQSGAKAGVAGIYNRSVYANEKRLALDRWAEHLLALVVGRPAKVVALRA